MVNAVLKDLPKEWNGVVVMDWSDGFWDKMKIKHNNLGHPSYTNLHFFRKNVYCRIECRCRNWKFEI